MLTTLDIDRKLLDAVVDATGEKTESEAVKEALKEYLHRENVQDIRSMSGRSNIKDTTARQRELDKKRHDFLERIRHD